MVSVIILVASVQYQSLHVFLYCKFKSSKVIPATHGKNRKLCHINLKNCGVDDNYMVEKSLFIDAA
jgi:hypothetical protein